jgi:putative transposase
VSSVPLQQAIRHQQAAYAAFFARRARHPRFKSRQGRQSAAYTRSAFRWRDGRLHLAKMGTPLALTWSWPGIDPAAVDPSTVTVSRDPCGRWYVAFAVEVPDPGPLPAAGRVAGVDLGITARAHRKVRAARTGFLHKASTSLVRDHDVIVLEDLAAQNMVRNRRLAKAISDCGWGAFRAMLAYKAARAGRRVIVIDRWYPSSKTCSACGYLLAELSLSTRAWQCPSCGTRHDRDHNAAKNIPAAGLAVAGDTPGHACGAGIRHSGSSRVRPAVKQEPRPVRAGIPVLQGGE